MRRLLTTVLVGALAAPVVACSPPKDPILVAFLFANGDSGQWAATSEVFSDQVVGICDECEYAEYFAEDDPATQTGQLEQALDQGADAIVLNATDAATGKKLVAAAGKVPVIAYDEFIPGADYFVSYDADVGGRKLAAGVVDELRGRGQVALLNAAGSGRASTIFRKAVRRVFGGSRIEIVVEGEPRTRSAEDAAAWLSGELPRHPAADLEAIVTSSDDQARGVIDALKEAKVPARDWPLIAGQDADIDAIRRIVAGEQSLTVFTSFSREAQQAAQLAVVLAIGGKVDPAPEKEVEGVPAFVFVPVVVAVDNLTDTVVRDGTYSIEEICDASVLDRCEELGIL